MTVHAARQRLRCHHCGTERPLQLSCENCGHERIAVGEGTQRIEESIARLFPTATVTRLDRDSTQKRGAMDAILSAVAAGETDILVGTQMLTKGHDFPRVTLVGVLNADQGLFGSDFRSSERLAQTVVQVAGRAGRADRAGEVLIQSHFPQHPLLQCLITAGYQAFGEMALRERREAGWPPFGRLLILRAEAHQRGPAEDFLLAAKARAENRRVPGLTLLGPAAAPLERRAGRYRLQLLVMAPNRSVLASLLSDWCDELIELPEARRVRYALDIDPQEL